MSDLGGQIQHRNSLNPSNYGAFGGSARCADCYDATLPARRPRTARTPMNEQNLPSARLSLADLATELQRLARDEPDALEGWIAGLSLRQQAELALRLPASERVELLVNAEVLAHGGVYQQSDLVILAEDFLDVF